MRSLEYGDHVLICKTEQHGVVTDVSEDGNLAEVRTQDGNFKWYRLSEVEIE